MMLSVLRKTRDEPKPSKTSRNQPKRPKTSQNNPKNAKQSETTQNFKIGEFGIF